MTYLKAKASCFVSPLLYGLAGSVLMALLIVAINVQHNLIVEREAITTPNNVQERIRNWVDNFGLKTQNKLDNAAYFKYEVTMRGGNPITIIRMIDRQNYVILHGRLKPSTKEEAMLSKLSQKQFDDLFDRLTLEVARQGLSGVKIDRASKEIYLEKRIPITAGLTEDVLIMGLDHIDASMLILQSIITNTLRNVGYFRN